MGDICERLDVAILANPLAGRGPRAHLVEELTAALRQRGLMPLLCRQREELTELVRCRSGTMRCVVAAGGDGTFNEVINRAPGIPISILPLGNENLAARQFGMAPSVEKLAAAIASASVRRLDLARAHGRLFALMAGAGIDAEIVHRVHSSRRSHISKRSYVLPILASIGSYAFPMINVENAHTGERLQGAAVFVFNVPQYALRLPLADRALPDDGWLDLWVFQRPGLANLARYLGAIVRGRHHELRDVQHRLVKEVRLFSEKPARLQVDGDAAGCLPVTTEVVPGALKLIVQ